MRSVNYICLALCMVLGLTTSLGMAQSPGTQTELMGCLSRTASGALQFQARPSGKIYALNGNISLLQHHVNQLVAIPVNHAGETGLNVDTLRVMSESCTSALPSKNVVAVAGKAARDVPAPNVTTTLSAGETTPGFQTESGMEQSAGTGANSPPVKYGYANSPYAPVNAEQAGQSEAAANQNAAAAQRAEMYPEHTLGVTQKSAPPSSVQAMRSAQQESNTTEQNQQNSAPR
jgi:hypothetical protein